MGTRQKTKDVDMRICCPNDDKVLSGQVPINICSLTSITTQVALSGGSSSKVVNDTSHWLFVEVHPSVFKALVLMDIPASVDSSRQGRLGVPESNSIDSFPILRHDVSPPPPPIPVFHQPNSQAFVKEALQGRLPTSPKQFYSLNRSQVFVDCLFAVPIGALKSMVFLICSLNTTLSLKDFIHVRVLVAGMNIFRLAGDLSHLAAILILLLKIYSSRSCKGLSGKTQRTTQL
ncbi:hypothetical protein EG68_12485 [Paragonimus skrjabini miyazakii]|uniref:Uncharacterized protein n=1 Tax=Paragonimus skrjabini miyazakii TaxID=59628 RepID=A0A8S9YGV6_9TREM|nr:hypothetical protein EG68_12485 [Paragonimus skrjabini miyazakii]